MSDHEEESIQLEDHFILRLPSDVDALGGKLKIDFEPDMRNATVKLGKCVFKAKHIDQEAIDRELKMILRADMDAAKMRWEVVPAHGENEQESNSKQEQMPDSECTSDSELTFDDFETSGEKEIFGGAVSYISGNKNKEVTTDRLAAHQQMELAEENVTGADLARSAIWTKFRHLQAELFKCETEVETYQSQVAALENPILKARLQVEIGNQMIKEQELKQQVNLP
ncbi:unnamed protein product [Soboliphyme baturini]|uniref:TAFII55_N domain-containing protein n=1 Tax=Soboliphyme baturini TaxID=241478 RepID=A0A183IQ91_9BILA|nr:unnamed protein product [Soboliphyme baturini]